MFRRREVKTIIIFLTIYSSLYGVSLDTIVGKFNPKISKNRLSQRLGIPHSIVEDNNGEIYIVDTAANKIRKILKNDKVITIVGSNHEGDSTGSPLEVNLKLPIDITFNKENNMIISDTYNNKIKKLTKDKVITIAGTGKAGFNGDGIATEKEIYYPKDILFYKDEIYFIDAGNNLIRKIDKKGKLVTILGAGDKKFNRYFIGKAKELKLHYPTAISFDKKGNLYVADNKGTYIIKIDLKTEKVTHFAGNGKIGIDKRVRIGWYPTETHIGIINSIYIKKGIVYLVSSSHNSIFYIKKGRIESLVDYLGEKAHYKKDKEEFLPLSYPTDILIKDKEIYIADKRNNYIRKIKNDIISIFVGFWNDKKKIDKLYYPNSISIDNNFVYVADTLNYRIVQFDKKFKNPSVVAGTSIKGFFDSYEKFFAKNVNIGFVTSLSICNKKLYLIGENNLWEIKDQILNKIKVDSPIDLSCQNDKLIILKENSVISFDGKTKKELIKLDNINPQKITSTKNNIHIIADNKIFNIENNRLKQICKNNKNSKFKGKKIKCGMFQIKTPTSIASDNKDTVYFYDSTYSKIFAIRDNILYHIAGNGKKGFDKFDGNATELSLNDPQDLFVKDNKLYFVDSSNNFIRVIDLKTISFEIKKKKEEIITNKEKKDKQEKNSKQEENKEKNKEKIGCNYSIKGDSFALFIILFFIIKSFIIRFQKQE